MLLLALVCVLLGGFIVVPLLRYASSVTRLNRLESAQLARAEAVKGALRTALASPRDLYLACSNSGLHVEVALASAGLDIPVATSCTTVADATEMTAADVRTAFTVVQAGATVPSGVVGDTYPGSGSSSTTAWWADTTVASTGQKIWLPELPSHALSHPSANGYAMPAGAPACRVFFPGTYSDPVVLSSATPTYFASGIYYFENLVHVTGSAQVVVGGGAIEGCSTDQDAAYNAVNAPKNHNITGYGATFVFGGAGRLLVDSSTAGSGPSLQFNARLVADTDIGGLPSKGVSIISVNGVTSGSGSDNLEVAGLLSVPKSMATSTPSVDAATVGYVPSTLIPSADPAAPAQVPIVSVESGSTAATVWIPGYVCVPQGQVSVSAGSAASGSSVQMVGGVLAATVVTTGTPPATLALGMVNRVVQKTFKIVSVSSTAAPRVQSTALVQMNDYGEFVVNSWEIRTIG